jgi:hypothetical protein
MRTSHPHAASHATSPAFITMFDHSKTIIVRGMAENSSKTLMKQFEKENEQLPTTFTWSKLRETGQ